METDFPHMETAQSRVARQRIMADLKTLAGDAEALLRATADDASDQANDARARLDSVIEKIQSTYADLQERAVDKAKDVAKKTDNAVRSHPYESIAAAFGVGLLIGVLLKRK
jgi:ElaB/YqjD/DUF883 family membrane-anchored ribosome-binding protein